MRSILFSAAVVCTTLAGFAPPASAATISVDAFYRNWYNPAGESGPDDAYPVGRAGEDLHNVFVFDLSGVTDVIVSATLVLQGDYRSPDASETYALFDVTTSPDIVLSGMMDPALFTDLGSGKMYASRTISAADAAGGLILMDLNQDAIADLRTAAGSRFVMGGRVTSLSGNATQFLFSSSRNAVAQLQLETGPAPPTPVPEPATLTLLGASLLGLTCRQRLRRWRR